MSTALQNIVSGSMFHQSANPSATQKESYPMTNPTSQPGTISHGTLRPQDLASSFLSALTQLNPAAAQTITQQYQDIIPLLESANEVVSPDFTEEQRDGLGWLIIDLSDSLSDCAPPQHYFGAHPGDGSDFGFWPEEDDEDYEDEDYEDEDEDEDDDDAEDTLDHHYQLHTTRLPSEREDFHADG